ncbi:MAG: hypothetical protein PUA89_08735 [Frisingicoccus sp.]|uniref:hypothetical protein n=1 Tax=Frisingicoccus sp. TaxID=1918627 RepID=UPI00260CC115|nr:hypothetical protein [Frisingicoccus sp.]MDD6232782.1 hypothetical protein [Frisingicoccus sp.]
MNSFETDLKRAVVSWGFGIGLVSELAILLISGFDSDIFRMCVPVLCTFPYTTAWLEDYESGFLKACLPRTSVNSYIMGKLLACGISGGLLETLGCQIFLIVKNDEKLNISLGLIFMSGMLWAVVSAVLAAASNSRYSAYGGSFVIYYFLVILHERYFKWMYCLYPYEWLAPEHTWIFDESGVILLVGGICMVFGCLYYIILWRCIKNV